MLDWHCIRIEINFVGPKIPIAFYIMQRSIGNRQFVRLSDPTVQYRGVKLT
jgi:hypothetical protein